VNSAHHLEAIDTVAEEAGVDAEHPWGAMEHDMFTASLLIATAATANMCRASSPTAAAAPGDIFAAAEAEGRYTQAGKEEEGVHTFATADSWSAASLTPTAAIADSCNSAEAEGRHIQAGEEEQQAHACATFATSVAGTAD